MLPRFKKGWPYNYVHLPSTLNTNFHLKIIRESRILAALWIFSQNNLFYDSQYGFLKNHSTEYAAMELTDKVLNDIDEINISLAIFIDLSKAFDALDHNILIKKLAHYVIKGTPIEWFTS